MKKFKKLMAMGLTAIMAVSAMSISAFAEEAVYNSDGELIGYSYSIEDVKDAGELYQTMRSEIQPFSLGTTVPAYNSTATNLGREDYIDDFSVTGTSGNQDTVYSGLYTNVASEYGIRFYGVGSYLDAINIKVYERTSSGSKLIDNLNPAAGIIGYKLLSSSTSKKYYVKLSARTANRSLSGSMQISNDYNSLLPTK